MTGDEDRGRRQNGGPSRGGDIVRRRRAGTLLVLLAVSLLIALTIGHGRGGKNPSTADELATLKVGQWIQVDGTLRADSSALCSELRLLTGDFLDDDWALKGFVQSLDAAKKELVIGGVSVQVTEDTGFDSPNRTFTGLSDLRAGLLVELEGTCLKSRKFLAMEVDDESDELAHTPWSRNQVMIVGRVERVEPSKRLVTAMGFVFQVTDRTRLRSVIQ